MKEPPGATRQDYARHIAALTERHGPDWVLAHRRQIDALWDNYRMLCWLRERPEDFEVNSAGDPPSIQFRELTTGDEHDTRPRADSADCGELSSE